MMLSIREFSFAIILLLVLTAFSSPQELSARPAQTTQIKIVFDNSHGQGIGSDRIEVDHLLEGNLTALGYEVIWASGGLNTSILENATGLVIGPLYGLYSGFLPQEIADIADWFAAGNRFLWVGCKADYEGEGLGTFINNNMSLILEAVGSHVYPESVEVDDFECNCGESYRTVGNVTSSDPFVAGIVSGVTKVLTHGTCALYGSNSSTPGRYVDMVPLEEIAIENVYPLLHSSPASFINNYEVDENPPEVHDNFQVGSFALCTLEVLAGPSQAGVIVVSGAAPYGNYRPSMYYHQYCGYDLDGYKLVNKAINRGIRMALSFVPMVNTSTTTPLTTPPPEFNVELIAFAAAMGIASAALLSAVCLRRKR